MKPYVICHMMAPLDGRLIVSDWAKSTGHSLDGLVGVMDVAPKPQSLAAEMNHSAFNLSNAIGAWTGGLAIAAGYGWASTGLVAAGLALLGLLVFVVVVVCEKRGNHSRRTASHNWSR